MSGSLRRIMTTEIIVSSFVNAFIFPGLIWLAPIPAPLEMGGADGVILSLVKGTAIPIFLMTTLLTLVLRKRFGHVQNTWLAPSRWWSRLLAGLPRAAPVRAIVFVVAAMVTILPLAILTAWGFKTYPLSDTSFLVFNVVYGLVIGLVVTPFIVLAVVSERSAATVVAPMSEDHIAR